MVAGHPTKLTCKENNRKLSNQKTNEAIACNSNFLKRSLNRDKLKAETISSGR